MVPTHLQLFKRLMKINRRRFRYFLTRLETVKPRGVNKVAAEADKEVWAETDCLACANCCKTMTPTFTNKDIKRISAHFGQTPAGFKEQWLYRERSTGDWMNRKQPCQFLDKSTNKCSIYEIRPDDCRGFPHHHKKPFTEWVHVYKQNVEYCPATYKLVEKMMERMGRV
ncbi:MAG TPA: YkgJ family cysteine cluster protein, partial [Lacibacter sp.]|nr:YkgJ family cysteine cluster protein [Lacibacter sp.]HMO90018.1 YkgJ family cysteine cluster protein [Lacibacter sp.]